MFIPVWNNFYRNTVLVAIVALLFFSVPANNLWWREAVNSGHTLLFIFLSFVIYHQIRARARFPNTLIIYLYVLILGLLLGAVIEALQTLVQREASISDMYKNFLGIMTGLCLISAFNLKNVHYQNLTRFLFVFVGAGFLMLGMMPLMQLSWHYIERKSAFPVIIDFDANWSSSFIHLNNAEMLKLPNSTQKKNDKLHLVRFGQGEYPGVSIIEPEPNWSGYHQLRLKVFSMNEHDINLTMRVHDKMHNQDYSDRFNKKLVIHPGLNKLEITLNQIQHGPLNRELDLTNIAGVILFSSEQEQQLRFYVSNLILE
jgi:hypothetical protein